MCIHGITSPKSGNSHYTLIKSYLTRRRKYLEPKKTKFVLKGNALTLTFTAADITLKNFYSFFLFLTMTKQFFRAKFCNNYSCTEDAKYNMT